MKNSPPIRAAGWISTPVIGARAGRRSPRGGEGHAGLAQRVGDPVGEQRLHAGPAGEDLEGRDALRGGVAVARRRDVVPDLAEDPAPGAHPDLRAVHGAKKGRDM